MTKEQLFARMKEAGILPRETGLLGMQIGSFVDAGLTDDEILTFVSVLLAGIHAIVEHPQGLNTIGKFMEVVEDASKQDGNP